MLSKITGTLILIFFVLVWSGMTLAFDAYLAHILFRQIRAIGYSKTTGSMTHSEVETVHERRSTTYRPKIQYEYSVAGTEYHGDRYRYGKMSSGGDWAKQIVATHPLGSEVDVYYAPADPSDAVLLVGVEGFDLFIAMSMLPFNLVMLAFWIAMGGAFRYRYFRPPAGGVRISDDGRYLRLRLSFWKPLYSGLAAAGIVAFAGVFVIAFGFRSNPSLFVMVITWSIILSIGAFVSIRYWRKLGGSRADLLLDDFQRSITLPQTLGRRDDVVVPAEKIAAIDVQAVTRPGAKGRVSKAYCPTVVFTDDRGMARRERIVEWSSKDRAEGLAAWLRKRLQIRSSSAANTY